ncbi:ATP-grasp domain-containing protein [Streptomyces rimosus]|uniref:preATP grasp domain-containing protein n=1 Tax=Streptomyces rimosus TaxID=1927 RepID=UPI0005180E8D|nr:ATP-grasp domain-containing protein [Streptomyces rimosus]
MESLLPGFNARLKAAVAGNEQVPFVFLGNFEVEEQWAVGEPGLPRMGFTGGGAVVNSMDEFAMLLAGEGDHVVLKARPDAGYLAYLCGLGLALPTVHVVAESDPARTVSQDALADPALQSALARAGDGLMLYAHGVSTVEEELAERTGLPLAHPTAAVCKAVNSKIYSRRVADELGIAQARGWACETVMELSRAVEEARELLAQGRKLVLKDAYGVSGKGIMVIESERRLDRVHRMVLARAEAAGSDRAGLVLEEWVTKQTDLNYQVTVGRDGAVRFDFVKEAITENGTHKGHRMPARLTPAQLEQVTDAGLRIGARLAADGYFGVAGMDALLLPDGSVFPVIEINARNNMSTYQVRLQEAFVGEGRIALARHYPLRLGAPLPFEELRGTLDGLLLERPDGAGLLVNNYATVNAAVSTLAEPGATADGRLYGLVVGDTAEQVTAIDTEITARLAAVTEGAVHVG